MSTSITAYGVYCATSKRQRMRYATTVLFMLDVHSATGCMACSLRDWTRCFAYGYEKHNSLTCTHPFLGVREIFGLHGHRYCNNSYGVMKYKPKTSHKTNSTFCVSPIDLNMKANFRPFHWVWVANCLHNQTATSSYTLPTRTRKHQVHHKRLQPNAL
jgi:hypothetical protein